MDTPNTKKDKPATLIDLHAKLDSDLKIDPSNLMEESASNLNKHAWYFGQLQVQKAMYAQQKRELAVLEKDRYNYYAGAAVHVHEYNLNHTGIKYNLEGDHMICDKRKGMEMIELKIEFFLKACDLMKDRSFAIRNQIELLKFQNGMG